MEVAVEDALDRALALLVVTTATIAVALHLETVAATTTIIVGLLTADTIVMMIATLGTLRLLATNTTTEGDPLRPIQHVTTTAMPTTPLPLHEAVVSALSAVLVDATTTTLPHTVFLLATTTELQWLV